MPRGARFSLQPAPARTRPYKARSSTSRKSSFHRCRPRGPAQLLHIRCTICVRFVTEKKSKQVSIGGATGARLTGLAQSMRISLSLSLSAKDHASVKRMANRSRAAALAAHLRNPLSAALASCELGARARARCKLIRTRRAEEEQRRRFLHIVRIYRPGGRVFYIRQG